jgi:hypothetical protein
MSDVFIVLLRPISGGGSLLDPTLNQQHRMDDNLLSIQPSGQSMRCCRVRVPKLRESAGVGHKALNRLWSIGIRLGSHNEVTVAVA